MNVKHPKLFGLMVLFCCLGLSGCLSMNYKSPVNNPTTPRWLNPFTFDQEGKVGETLHDVAFKIMFVSSGGGELTVKNCFEVLALGETAIAQREFSRWEWLKSSCLGASSYYRSPETAISYWGNTFNLELLKTFPATAVPYLGGQGLDGRSGDLGKKEPTLTLVESGDNSVKVSIDDMVIDYVVLARADFNRDGYQDMFVRLDWYIENSFGEGFDWLVLTKTSPNATPMMLWRK